MPTCESSLKLAIWGHNFKTCFNNANIFRLRLNLVCLCTVSCSHLFVRVGSRFSDQWTAGSRGSGEFGGDAKISLSAFLNFWCLCLSVWCCCCVMVVSCEGGSPAGIVFLLSVHNGSVVKSPVWVSFMSSSNALLSIIVCVCVSMYNSGG